MPTQRDHEYARELRKLLLRGSGRALLDVSYVRRAFGGGAFSPERRDAMDEALRHAGIAATPRLSRLGRHEQVFLEVCAPASRAHHPLVHRVLWRWRRTRTLVVLPAVWVVTLAASLTGLGVITTPWTHDDAPATAAQDRPMSGDLNIAVAPLSGTDQTAGIALGDEVARALRRQAHRLDPGLDVQVRGPDQLSSTARPGSAAAAGVLARRLMADIVVYGTLRTSADATVITPRFWLDGQRLPFAGELVGSFDYGAPIQAPYSIRASPQAHARVRRALQDRTLLLASVFAGVGELIAHDPRRAQTVLEKTLRLAGPDRPTASLARLLLGNAAGQQRRFARAAAQYRAAAREPALRGRARWGLAEMAYEQARGRCDHQSADPRGLRSARRRFAVIGTSGLLGAKARFGLGQVDLCLSHASLADRWDPARREFDAVIAAYRTGAAALRDDAAEAHAGLGLIAMDTTGPKTGSAAAAKQYQAAARVTSSDARRAFFLWMVGRLDVRLGRRDEAEAAYRAASAARPDAALRPLLAAALAELRGSQR